MRTTRTVNLVHLNTVTKHNTLLVSTLSVVSHTSIVQRDSVLVMKKTKSKVPKWGALL